MEENLHLEEVAPKYPIMLIDESALSGPFSISKSSQISERKIDYYKRLENSAIFFREFLEKGGNFYVTSLVLEEYSHGAHFPYRKAIAAINRHGEKDSLQVKVDSVQVVRQRKATSKAKRGLISSLESNRKILYLDGYEMREYGSLSGRYTYFLNKEKLSKTDLDFLILGLVVSKMRGGTCMFNL